MTRIPALLVTACLVLPAVVTRADPPAQAYDVRAAFLEADSNKDGEIEIGEFYDRLVDIFYLGDVNKDGYLDPTEYDAVVVIHEDFTAVDRDKDGRISRKEFVRSRLPLFRAADKNDDGVLSLDEVVQMYEVKGKK